MYIGFNIPCILCISTVACCLFSYSYFHIVLFNFTLLHFFGLFLFQLHTVCWGNCNSLFPLHIAELAIKLTLTLQSDDLLAFHVLKPWLSLHVDVSLSKTLNPKLLSIHLSAFDKQSVAYKESVDEYLSASG